MHQRRHQELLGEFGVVLVEPLFQRRVQEIDDFVQVLEILSRNFELRSFVQVVQTFVFGKRRHCQRQDRQPAQ
jgi:hypothetical protein